MKCKCGLFIRMNASKYIAPRWIDVQGVAHDETRCRQVRDRYSEKEIEDMNRKYGDPSYNSEDSEPTACSKDFPTNQIIVSNETFLEISKDLANPPSATNELRVVMLRYLAMRDHSRR